jgi:hypothetical protein
MKNVVWGLLRRVALVRIDVSEEGMTNIIMMAKIGELGTTLVVTGNRSTPRRNTVFILRSSEMSVLARATRCDLPDGDILQRYYESQKIIS